MNLKRLKGYALPLFYSLILITLFISLAYVGKVLQAGVDTEDVPVIVNDDTSVPVIKEEQEIKGSKITKPFTSANVSISKSYYDMTDDEETQQKSLIYYEKTYLQNSGVLYTSNESFDVMSAYDGTVTNVGKDDILGNFVEITHNTNLKTVYYSLNEVTVKKDDVVTSGMVIGTSGDNLLEQKSNYSLLFEVYYNGFTMDPEYFYNASIDELS